MEEKIKVSKLTNILLNLSGGLLPKDLTEREIKILEEGLGKDWFEQLGYDKYGCKRPTKGM